MAAPPGEMAGVSSASHGRLISGLGRPVPANQRITANLALFEDGTVYVAEAARQEEEIRAFLETLHAQGRSVGPIIPVADQQSVRTIYDEAAARELSLTKKPGTIQPNRGGATSPPAQAAPGSDETPARPLRPPPPPRRSIFSMFGGSRSAKIPPPIRPRPAAANPNAQPNAQGDGRQQPPAQLPTQLPAQERGVGGRQQPPAQQTDAAANAGVQQNPQLSPQLSPQGREPHRPPTQAEGVQRRSKLMPSILDPNAPLVMESEADSAEVIQSRLKNNKLLTGAKGPVKIGNFLINSLALFEDGTLYVVRGQQNNNHVVSFIEGQRMIGTRILRISPITYRELQNIYDEAGETLQKTQEERTSADKQKEFLEIVRRAAMAHASDVHLTLWPTSMSVEFRVDGVIEKVGEMGYQEGRSLLIAAYNMADVSGVSHQMLQYQEARISAFSAALPSSIQALRLQFNPLVFRGRILIVRLLYTETQQTIKTLGDLGWNEEQQTALAHARQQVTGVTIISGPTGSGKSTTLKILLETLKKEGLVGSYKDRHILTVEDPPEYVIDEVHQMPVPEAETPEERDLEFSKAINASLRSDPDTIVIGEIRDKESAKLAFIAAMSGHQVWTTLHANSAVSIIPRLHDIGVEDYKIADPENIAALIGQRLVRALCPKCSVPLPDALKDSSISLSPAYERRSPQDIAADLEKTGRNPLGVRLAAPGCNSCRNGYFGRSIIGEVILPDVPFLDLAARGKMVETQRYWREEMKGRDFKDHAMTRVEAGTLDPMEYDRWCGPIWKYGQKFAAADKKTRLQVQTMLPEGAEPPTQPPREEAPPTQPSSAALPWRAKPPAPTHGEAHGAGLPANELPAPGAVKAE